MDVGNPSMSDACWSCGSETGEQLLCSQCRAVQAPRELNPFERLNLEPIFSLDEGILTKVYFHQQSLLHPDKFVGASKREKQYVQAHSEAINEAFERLKNPQKRLEALLEMEGMVDRGIPDDMFLMNVMEWRQRLEEEKDLSALNEEIIQVRDRILSDVKKSWSRKEGELLGQLSTHLQYLGKILDEIKEKSIVI